MLEVNVEEIVNVLRENVIELHVTAQGTYVRLLEDVSLRQGGFCTFLFQAFYVNTSGFLCETCAEETLDGGYIEYRSPMPYCFKLSFPKLFNILREVLALPVAFSTGLEQAFRLAFLLPSSGKTFEQTSNSVAVKKNKQQVSFMLLSWMVA